MFRPLPFSMMQQATQRFLRGDLVRTGMAVGLGRIGGFLIPFLLAACYGSSRTTDVFFVVFSAVIACLMVITHLFESVFVAHLPEHASDRSQFSQFVSQTLLRTLVGLALLLPIAAVLGPLILNAVTSWSPSDIRLARQITWSLAPLPWFAAAASIFIGALNYHKRFTVGAVSPLFRTLPAIIFLFVADQDSAITGLAIAYSLGESLRALVALIAYRRCGLRLTRVPLRLPSANQDASRCSPGNSFGRAASIQLVGFVCFSAAPIACQLAAARLQAGDLSVFSYALHLRNVPHVLLTTVFGTVFLATWARALAQNQSFLPKVQRDLPTAVLLASAVAASGILLAPFLLIHLFPSLAENPRALDELSFLFILLMLSLPIDLGAYLVTHCQLLLGLHWSYLSAALCRLGCIVVLTTALGIYFGLRGIGVAVLIANLTFAIMVLLSVFRCVSRRSNPRSTPLYRGLQPEGRG